MDWDAFTPIPSLVGGILIGLATGLALFLNGKIAGISGVVGRILRPAPGDVAWRVWFLLGLAAGGAVMFFSYAPARALDLTQTGLPLMVAAGFLVGVGTRVGGGCTSGHGVCGISRGSLPGVIGTITFMAAAGLVVYLRRHALGGGA